MSTASRAQAFRPGLRVRRSLAVEIDPVAVMDQAVEDGVGVGGVADQGVPLIDRELAGDDGGAAAVAILEDLQEVVAGRGVERLEAQSSRMRRSTRPSERRMREWRPSPRAKARSVNSRGAR
jgi:hypothetical protein